MKLLAFVTSLPAIYHGFSSHKTFWEQKFTPVNMTSFLNCNVRGNSEIKNGEKYIFLDISSNLDFLYKG